MRTLTLLLVLGLLTAVAASPAGAAGTDTRPRELQPSSCSTVKVAEKPHLLYRYHLSCSFARRWSRKLNATGGRSKPRGFTCTSGSKFRSAGYCVKGNTHFGWYPGE